MLLTVVTLHPFEYDPAVKYSHKFMVQSMFVPDGMNVTDVENLVCVYRPIYKFIRHNGQRLHEKIKAKTFMLIA